MSAALYDTASLQNKNLIRMLNGFEPVGNHNNRFIIEDMELFSLLHNMDKLTLEILFMKMDGYGSKEISEKTGLSVNAIDLRIFKLKKKLKNFL